MAWFAARNTSTSSVPASAPAIWSIITDPRQLAELTPLIASIEPNGDRWTWKLHGIDALGLRVAATFTETMTFVEERQIVFSHTPPPGVDERAAVDGVYDLTPVGQDETLLRVDLTLSVELPLPRLSGGAVERVLRTSMRLTGQRFAENLYEELGLDPDDVDVTELPEP